MRFLFVILKNCELGIVPYIELEPTDHPLALEQREGITMERVKELAMLYLHPE
jgi:hypothetical protein